MLLILSGESPIAGAPISPYAHPLQFYSTKSPKLVIYLSLSCIHTALALALPIVRIRQDVWNIRLPPVRSPVSFLSLGH